MLSNQEDEIENISLAVLSTINILLYKQFYFDRNKSLHLFIYLEMF